MRASERATEARSSSLARPRPRPPFIALRIVGAANGGILHLLIIGSLAVPHPGTHTPHGSMERQYPDSPTAQGKGGLCPRHDEEGWDTSREGYSSIA